MGLAFSGNSFFVSDGQKLFLFDGSGNVFVAENASLTDFCINVNDNIESLMHIEGASCIARGPREITIDITLIAQEMSIQDDSTQDCRFAMDMTVRELLEVIQGKLKGRT